MQRTMKFGEVPLHATLIHKGKRAQKVKEVGEHFGTVQCGKDKWRVNKWELVVVVDIAKAE